MKNKIISFASLLLTLGSTFSQAQVNTPPIDPNRVVSEMVKTVYINAEGKLDTTNYTFRPVPGGVTEFTTWSINDNHVYTKIGNTRESDVRMGMVYTFDSKYSKDNIVPGTRMGLSFAMGSTYAEFGMLLTKTSNYADSVNDPSITPYYGTDMGFYTKVGMLIGNVKGFALVPTVTMGTYSEYENKYQDEKTRKFIYSPGILIYHKYLTVGIDMYGVSIGVNLGSF